MGCKWEILHVLLAIATVPAVLALGVLTVMLWNELRRFGGRK